ncbi:MAG TPA: hypothetical protein VLI90_09000 [Tepidisphaeraceae bacterium]|nr:hypothetical protein [Tepidisphaeraceae bacterium]
MESILPDSDTAALRDALSSGAPDAAVRERNGSTYALRNLLSTFRAVRALAERRRHRPLPRLNATRRAHRETRRRLAHTAADPARIRRSHPLPEDLQWFVA